MISEQMVKRYCSEDPSLIENYSLAIADQTQIWYCHHRGELLPCGRFKAKDLMKFGLYFKRPAAELIFLTHAEHQILHHKGVPRSEATKQAISDAQKGVPKSEEHKQKMSKKILQFTKSGEFVREWPSMTAIWQELGIRPSSICACCKGSYKSAGGYIWRYAE